MISEKLTILPDRKRLHDQATASEANLSPVWTKVPIGDETPENAYLKIRQGRPYAFLLESMEGDDKTARYSFVGTDPIERLVSDETGITRIRGVERTHVEGSPIPLMRGIMGDYVMRPRPELPRFSGGAVGYFAYDIVRGFEKIPDSNGDDLGMPDLHFIIAGTVVVFDHVQRSMYIIANAPIDPDGSGGEYDRAVEQIESIAHRLSSSEPGTASVAGEQPGYGDGADVEATSNRLPEEYQDAVRRAKEYIMAGDAFQVVLSQRFSAEAPDDPFDVYRNLKRLNPSPYLFYLHFDEVQIVGASPETMVLVEDGQAMVRPIAGTRRRGSSAEEDSRLMDELINDPKERAEHIMLVDLGRNDLGRVCDYGTVRTSELMSLEKYSHVIHIVSTVDGQLRDGVDGFDVLRATFPAGTLSGAPKIRAMEIIDELETSRRGVYGGALGYVGFSGNLDLCITIRTLIIKDGKAYIQAGAGIVADSDPLAEHTECQSKAAASLRALAGAGTKRAST